MTLPVFFCDFSKVFGLGPNLAWAKTKPAQGLGRPGPERDFLVFWGTPILRTLLENFDPPWPLRPNRCGKDLILNLSVLGFHQNLSQVFAFTNKVRPFMKRLFSSFVRLRPKRAGVCVSTHTPEELLDFQLLNFPIWGVRISHP